MSHIKSLLVLRLLLYCCNLCTTCQTTQWLWSSTDALHTQWASFTNAVTSMSASSSVGGGALLLVLASPLLGPAAASCGWSSPTAPPATSRSSSPPCSAVVRSTSPATTAAARAASAAIALCRALWMALSISSSVPSASCQQCPQLSYSTVWRISVGDGSWELRRQKDITVVQNKCTVMQPIRNCIQGVSRMSTGMHKQPCVCHVRSVLSPAQVSRSMPKLPCSGFPH